MPVIDVEKDLDNHTLTITAQFDAPVERVWALYADPRQLEKVWGPPGYPATFVDHDLQPGGRMNYYMTSPEGEKYGGYWDVTSVEEPTSFAFRDGFADAADFSKVEGMPESEVVYSFRSADGGTVARYVTSYADADALQKVLEMGMEEGSRSAINQIDEFLAQG